jgi:hypothetical protein
MAETMSDNLDYVERIEHMIVIAESRRDAVLHEIGRHRSTIADATTTLHQCEQSEIALDARSAIRALDEARRLVGSARSEQDPSAASRGRGPERETGHEASGRGSMVSQARRATMSSRSSRILIEPTRITLAGDRPLGRQHSCKSRYSLDRLGILGKAWASPHTRRPNLLTHIAML